MIRGYDETARVAEDAAVEVLAQGALQADASIVLGALEHIIERSKGVMATVFPDLAKRVKFHIPDETEKRHGQAIAAASLPRID